MNKLGFWDLRRIVKKLPKWLENKDKRRILLKESEVFSVEEYSYLNIKEISQLIELSTRSIEEIIDMLYNHWSQNYIAREFGLDYKIWLPEDTEVCEVEDYMRKLEIYFNWITKESKLISAFYIIWTWAIECLEKDESGKSKSKRIREFDKEKYENIQYWVHLQEDTESWKKFLTVKFSLPWERKEYIVMTFDLDIDNEIVLKHDLVMLLNILEWKSWAKLIEEMMNKKSHMYSDSMTWLKNSSYLKETLSKAWHNYSWVFIDIAEFKKINDENGQAFWDRAIQEVAKNLEFLVRPNDKVIRIGWDEFFILFENWDCTKEQIELNINNFINRLKKQLEWLKLEKVPIKLHIWHAVSTKDKSKSAIDLIIDANNNVVKDSAWKLYRKIADFESLKPKEAFEYIRLLFKTESFNLHFFNVINSDDTEIWDFFAGLYNVFNKIKIDLSKWWYNSEELSELEKYIAYISIFEKTPREELRAFFLQNKNPDNET